MFNLWVPFLQSARCGPGGTRYAINRELSSPRTKVNVKVLFNQEKPFALHRRFDCPNQLLASPSHSHPNPTHVRPRPPPRVAHLLRLTQVAQASACNFGSSSLRYLSASALSFIFLPPSPQPTPESLAKSPQPALQSSRLASGPYPEIFAFPHAFQMIPDTAAPGGKAL